MGRTPWFIAIWFSLFYLAASNGCDRTEFRSEIRRVNARIDAIGRTGGR